jgi:hypothetical protein
LSVVTDPEKNMLYEQPNEFGFTLAAEEKRHIDIPLRGVDPSDFPENAKASLPTFAQLISGDFNSVVLITAAYKTIFGRVEHVGDCVVHDRQLEFRHCWGDNKRIESPMGQ